MKFIILHGTLGSPEGNWFPWLAGELEKLGHTTVRPQLPTPKGQNPDNWVKAITEIVNSLGGPDNQTVLVAHSMSCLATCHYLATINKQVRACFFVSGFANKLPLQEPYPTLNDPFSDKPIDWDKVRQNCGKFVCLAGDNDPYVPLDIARDFAEKLSAEFIVIPGGGHLSTKAGFTQFPQLLENINNLQYPS
ncbi:MAG: alpha/beta hydrolase [Patescibacteria group bacterium]